MGSVRQDALAGLQQEFVVRTVGIMATDTGRAPQSSMRGLAFDIGLIVAVIAERLDTLLQQRRLARGMGIVALETLAILNGRMHDLGGELVVARAAEVPAFSRQHVRQIGPVRLVARRALAVLGRGMSDLALGHVLMALGAQFGTLPGQEMRLFRSVGFVAFQTGAFADGRVRVLGLRYVVVAFNAKRRRFLHEQEFLRGLVRIVALEAFTILSRAVLALHFIHQIRMASEADILHLAADLLGELRFVTCVAISVGVGGMNNDLRSRWSWRSSGGRCAAPPGLSGGRIGDRTRFRRNSIKEEREPLVAGPGGASGNQQEDGDRSGQMPRPGTVPMAAGDGARFERALIVGGRTHKLKVSDLRIGW